jgi:hypothetical protein
MWSRLTMMTALRIILCLVLCLAFAAILWTGRTEAADCPAGFPQVLAGGKTPLEVCHGDRVCIAANEFRDAYAKWSAIANQLPANYGRAVLDAREDKAFREAMQRADELKRLHKQLWR